MEQIKSEQQTKLMMLQRLSQKNIVLTELGDILIQKILKIILHANFISIRSLLLVSKGFYEMINKIISSPSELFKTYHYDTITWNLENNMMVLKEINDKKLLKCLASNHYTDIKTIGYGIIHGEITKKSQRSFCSVTFRFGKIIAYSEELTISPSITLYKQSKFYPEFRIEISTSRKNYHQIITDKFIKIYRQQESSDTSGKLYYTKSKNSEIYQRYYEEEMRSYSDLRNWIIIKDLVD